MTLEEAREIVARLEREAWGYFDLTLDRRDGKVTIDGNYTLRELEALLIVARASDHSSANDR